MRMRVKVGVCGKAAQWLGAVRRSSRVRYFCQFLYLHAQTKCVCMWWVVCVCVCVWWVVCVCGACVCVSVCVCVCVVGLVGVVDTQCQTLALYSYYI